MKQKIVKSCIFILIACTLLPACGYKDIDKRFFAVAIGIDLKDDEEKPYEITLALAVPSTKIEPKSAITQIETIQAGSIADGLRQIKAKLDKELDLGHCKSIIIGEALANEDIRDVVYWIARRRDIQNIVAIAIGVPTAADIVKVQPDSDRFPGNTINFFFSRDTTQSSYTYRTTFTEVYKRVLEPGLDPIIPIISTEGDSTFTVNTVALLDKQKVKIVLTPRETQLLNQLSNKNNYSYILGSYESDKITLAINNMKATFKINEFASEPAVSFKIKQKVRLEDLPKELTEETNTNYSDIISQLEQQYSEDCIALLEKIKQEKIDPYGFGLRYRAKHPISIEQYNEVWPPLYETVKFEVNTKMDLKSTGLLK